MNFWSVPLKEQRTESSRDDLNVVERARPAPAPAAAAAHVLKTSQRRFLCPDTQRGLICIGVHDFLVRITHVAVAHNQHHCAVRSRPLKLSKAYKSRKRSNTGLHFIRQCDHPALDTQDEGRSGQYAKVQYAKAQYAKVQYAKAQNKNVQYADVSLLAMAGFEIAQSDSRVLGERLPRNARRETFED
ncbi:hypothetical protein EVAR_54743_1 [Eumeta japonica]|uniref:Uncharacterized protein n=1 Tax=Eumeta variegata TaxID=151549 RepID=A0A4C1Z179_EUMVA|nr:hypothetical protein EVAR_54743_1 [Eumeta japonica]